MNKNKVVGHQSFAKWALLCAGVLFFKQAFCLEIINKPINFDTKRIELTNSYLNNHYGIIQNDITIKPKMIVVHCTESGHFQQMFNYFYPSELTSDRPDILKQSPLNVSAHYLVDRDGKIYQLMPSNWMARHVIGLDYMAIGIENIGCAKGYPLTQEQIYSNANLILYLKNQYPDIDYLIGHYEYARFKKSPLWREKNTHYFTTKTDPGSVFMKKLRVLIKALSPSLQLKSEP